MARWKVGSQERALWSGITDIVKTRGTANRQLE
jgi:hypothetical protein